MKLCPVCEEEVQRRVDGACPKCGAKIELVRGQYLQADFIAPVKALARVVERQLKKTQDNIFPYRIPQHMMLRTHKVLGSMWSEIFPVVHDRGISADETIALFEMALEELIRKLPPDNVELGLMLWYISGKETNKFKRLLTKYVKSRERLVGLQATEDEWL